MVHSCELFPTLSEAALADLSRNRVLSLQVTRAGHHYQKVSEKVALDDPMETPI